MRTSLGQMDGNDWEEHCQKLLRLRYKDDYQEVPAKFGGDLGIEGFTRTGLVFQCYCPDEDPSGKDLYDCQLRKITRDIEKLIKNANQISLLGAGIIKEWHFLTPRYNSRYLVSHCRSKEYKVVSKKLPWIHNSFSILLKTEDDFIPEMSFLPGMGSRRVLPTVEEPPPEKLDAFLNSDNEIVQNIRKKLRKLLLPPSELAKLTRDIVTSYIIGQDEIENLNKRYPSIYSSVIQLKSATQSQLSVRTLSCTSNHGALLRETLEHYEGELSSGYSENLSIALIKRLSSEAISDWLGRCPLDFPDKKG